MRRAATRSVAARIDRLDLDRLDPAGMLRTVEQSPQQWAQALEVARGSLLPDVGDVRAVIVAGMGGSGVVADIVSGVAARCGRVPVLATKDYRLVELAGPDTLVVAVSHSGNTEETLACLDAAGAVGAPRFAVSAGGGVTDRAAAEGFPVVRVPARGAPRANLAYLTVPVLVSLERAGLLVGAEAQLAGIPDHLQPLAAAWRHDRPAERNPVKRLALDLEGLVPVFYGGRGLMAVAAMRAKTQTNENGKRPAFWNELPELDHNEVVGWHGLPDRCRAFAVVELRSRADEHPRVAQRFGITREVVANRLGGYHAVEVNGPTPLARFAAAVLFVDLLSVYLALLEGHDPTPIAAIELLKRRLAEAESEGR